MHFLFPQHSKQSLAFPLQNTWGTAIRCVRIEKLQNMSRLALLCLPVLLSVRNKRRTTECVEFNTGRVTKCANTFQFWSKSDNLHRDLYALLRQFQDTQTEWRHRECIGHCCHCHWHCCGDEWTEWRHQNCYSTHCLYSSNETWSPAERYKTP